MLGEAFEALDRAIAILFILCCIFVPLGVWKLIELVLELFKHVSISWN